MLGYVFIAVIIAVIAILAIRVTKKQNMFVKVDNPQLVSQLIQEHPSVWEHFGVAETSTPEPLPEHLLHRATWRKFPAELRGNEPVLNIAPDFALKCDCFTCFEPFPRLAFILELGAVYKTTLSSILIMSEKLGLTDSHFYGKLYKSHGNLKIQSKREELALWRDFDYPATYEEVRGQLYLICQALGVDYDSLGYSYNPSSSRYIGLGKIGISFAIIGNISSAINTSAKKAAFEDANVYAKYNDVVRYFLSSVN